MAAIIDVCQECGEYIEPIPVPGTGKVFVVCTSDDCTFRRLGPVPLLRLSEPLSWHARAWLMPVVTEPANLFRITGA